MKLFKKIFNKKELTPLEESTKLIDSAEVKEIKKPGSQKEEVLAHLNERGTINSMQAIKAYGITRLADKIHQLRKDGHNITTSKFRFTNRYGNASSYGIYRINK